MMEVSLKQMGAMDRQTEKLKESVETVTHFQSNPRCLLIHILKISHDPTILVTFFSSYIAMSLLKNKILVRLLSHINIQHSKD